MYDSTDHTNRPGDRSDEMNLALAIAFSRCIGRPRIKSGIGRNLQRGLWIYAQTQFPDGDRIHPAPLPGLRAQPARTTRSIVKDLGLDKHAWARQWEDLTQKHGGMNAQLPGAILHVAFPDELWDVAAKVVLDGPSIAKGRIEHLLREEARRQVDADRSKEAGRVSDGTVKALADGLKRFMRELSDLAQHHPRLRDLLESWTIAPEIAVPRGRKAPRNADAPPLWLVRMVVQGLDAEIETRLGVPLDRQASLIRQMTRAQLDRSGTATLLRDRCALYLLTTIGMRADAAIELNRGDYMPEYVDPDGEVGPAVRLFPDKTMDLEDAAIKPIPSGLAQVIETNIAWLETYDARPRAAGDPLLAATKSDSMRRYTYAALYARCAGQGKGDTGGALLPRKATWDAETRAVVMDRSYGYPPHRIRSFVVRTLRSSQAETVADELGYDGTMLSVSEALVDHEEIYTDRLKYAGESTPSGRIRLSKVGTHTMWRLLTGDDGARRVPDETAFREGLRRRKALESESARIRHELDALYSPTSGRRPASDQLLEMLMNAQRLSFRDREVSDALRQIDRELETLRHDPQRRVTVPDWLCNAVPVVDLDAIEKHETGGAVRSIAGRPAVRKWVTVPELGELAGTSSDATPRNWVAGKGIKAGDPSAPWEPSRVPVDATVPRRKKILVSGLKDSFLDQGDRRQMLAEMLGHWPEGWSAELLTEHASRPAWMEEEQRRAA